MQPLQPSNKCWQTIAAKLLIEASFSTLARGLQCLDAWYQSLTSSLFFLANELERTSSLSRLGPVAQIDDCVGGNSTRVSVCASLWVGRECFEVYHECELRRLASNAGLLLSQVVDRVGRIEVPPPLAAAFMYMYRLTGGSCSGLLRKRATANPFARASCSSWSSNGHTSTTVWQKNQERTTLPSTTSDRQKAWVKRKNVCKSKAWPNGANLKAHIASRAFPREVPARGRFFSNAVFNHFPLEDFSQTNANRLVGAPRAHFRQKLKIDK